MFIRTHWIKFVALITVWLSGTQPQKLGLLEAPIHPYAEEFTSLAEKCGRSVKLDDEDCSNKILSVATHMVNVYSTLLLQDVAQDFLQEAFYHIDPTNGLGKKVSHMLAVLSFSQGELGIAQIYWDTLERGDLASRRSLAAQLIMTGKGDEGLEALTQYSSDLGERFLAVLNKSNIPYNFTFGAGQDHVEVASVEEPGRGLAKLPREPLTESTEDVFLNFLYNEAQGTAQLRPPMVDLIISCTNISALDGALRFRLGVGLAKLGLFDLSLQHVSISATPWENPLYRLRARLSFPPIHSSVRALAQAVDSFEQQGEMLLLFRTPASPSTLMASICNSLNDAALALQALPLLHLAGYSSPRHKLVIGHSPVALPVLLGEVLQTICPPSVVEIEDPLSPEPTQLENGEKKVLRIAFLSGTFDGQPGHTVAGIMESLSKHDRKGVTFTAISFPTPRDATTDHIRSLFDEHVNLNPLNKTQAVERVLRSKQDLIVFTDAGMDSRSFALAHERLVRYQVLLWGWGGTLAIPAIDFYIIPEPLWFRSQCATVDPRVFDAQEIRVGVYPQELFAEQTVFFDGLPPLPSYMLDKRSTREVLATEGGILMNYLLPPSNSSHTYLVPCSVKQIHPEFDAALSILLKTDPMAMIVIAVPRAGRDSLPSTHSAVRHDLMHPTNPVAAVNKLRLRLRRLVGDDIRRVRVLPPVERTVFHALELRAGVVLDPFPVGLHAPLIEALSHGVPIVSAPSLQECTNRHADGITRAFGLDNLNQGDVESGTVMSSPATPEEYAVLAIQMQHDKNLRLRHIPKKGKARSLNSGEDSHGKQLLRLASSLIQ